MVNEHLLAACIMHMEGYYSTKSLAWRNNNPGNIEWSNGQKKLFTTKEEGYNALVQDIVSNRGSSLGVFLDKYAPPTENDTSLYIQVISALTGYTEDTII